jgi:hypothetical protein
MGFKAEQVLLRRISLSDRGLLAELFRFLLSFVLLQFMQTAFQHLIFLYLVHLVSSAHTVRFCINSSRER